jgi:hypothetical protein
VDRSPWPQASGIEVLRNERLLIYRPGAGDTFAGIAARFLGNADKAWWIADANPGAGPEIDVPLVVPAEAAQPDGSVVRPLPDRAHPLLPPLRPGNSKMVISPANFAAQMSGWRATTTTWCGWPTWRPSWPASRRCRGVPW